MTLEKKKKLSWAEKNILWSIITVGSVAITLFGIFSQDVREVILNGVILCLSCIGIG